MNYTMWLKYLKGSAFALRLAIGEGSNYGLTYNKRAVKALRVVIPYCLHPVRAGDDAPLIWLNRDYKPLGVLSYDEYVDYDDFPWMHVVKSDPALLSILPECEKVQAFCDAHAIFYIYNNATSPDLRKSNAKRLLNMIDLVLDA